ncbi:CRISPR-associated helicase Cas3' [Lysinibacillus telephonicus]|uniref:CRISPR-associated helicase Cas3' n=1 Tax=Lysinibacillus telephonicus TaxID=1714840 RepID=UPI003BA281A5
MDFIAHIRVNDGEQQLLKIHLKEVQELAEKIGEKLGIPHVTGLAGMLHDMGKYSNEFQEYLSEAYNNPNNPPKRGSVNHSTAGGRFLMENYHFSLNPSSNITPILIECVSNAIYSHHGQLLDMVNPEGKSPFMDRLNPSKEIEFGVIYKKFFEEVMDESSFNKYVEQADKEFQNLFNKILSRVRDTSEAIKMLTKTFAFLTKFIFSALIDADRTNSRQFDEQTTNYEYETEKLFQQFESNLQNSLKEKQMNSTPNEITKLRQQMSENCVEKASLPTGIYTLSIPTGGGKTLASLRFALKHAQIHNIERIIYSIPFTTIIEQNAEEVRTVLDAEQYVLEHHSNVVSKEYENEENSMTFEEYQQLRNLKNAKDNWDAPIVFTTMVQFLNTFFDGASRNTRRLHNLANSVIIFDEVQTIPVQCISLFNETLNFLKEFCNTTIILCTATQPALEYVEKNIIVDGELIDNLPTIAKAFKRTEIVPLLKTEGWKTEELAALVNDQLNQCGNVLVILNTKKVVKELFDYLNSEDIKIYHLSTSMCPAHRKIMLEEIRKQLKRGERIVCLSTQLIEAGVDVSFNCVIRSLAGLDSIAQAAGRCNRHGEAEFREVYVINHAEEKLSKLRTIEEGKKCTDFIIRDLIDHPDLFEGNLLSTSSMNHYFKMFFKAFESEVDYPIRELNTWIYEILLGTNGQFKKAYPRKRELNMFSSFKTAADYFEVIEGNTYSILVPYGEGKELINILTGIEKINDFTSFFKKAQQFSVNVFKYEFDALLNNRLIEIIDFGFTKIYIATDNAYDPEYGLSVSGEAKLEEYNF